MAASCPNMATPVTAKFYKRIYTSLASDHPNATLPLPGAIATWVVRPDQRGGASGAKRF